MRNDLISEQANVDSQKKTDKLANRHEKKTSIN